MSVFTSIFPPSETRPRSQFFTAVKASFIRDALSLRTWVSLGAVLQSILVLVFPTRYAVLPAIIYLVTRLVDSILIWSGIFPNPQMLGVLPGKVSAQIPGSTTPSQSPIVIIKLAARSNHPLGIFHPHMRVISDYFNRMVKDLDDHSEKYDFLGASSYIANERATANEVMILAYFRTYDGLHAWSHAPGGLHLECLSYWNNQVMGKGKAKDGCMFSILHELYQAPTRKWENIYINYHPTGFGSTTFRIDSNGQQQWASPLVDASKGRLRSSKGRLALSEDQEHEIDEKNPYDSGKA